jgi:hypothetical protein
MGKFFDQLNEYHIRFIEAQKMFFVATAPTGEGTVNLSPKGYDTLKVLDASTIVYVDYPGSGNETAIHIEDNGKVTLMWCSYDESPLILRAYGQGKTITKATEEFNSLINQHFTGYNLHELRQLFVITVQSVQSSCGWGVPYMSYVDDRNKLKIEAAKG